MGGYRSPRNMARSMMERGAIVTPLMVITKHPEIPLATAKAALESLVSIKIAKHAGPGFYEIEEAHRVRPTSDREG